MDADHRVPSAAAPPAARVAREAGFSLIETIAVLAIAGILLAVTVPSITAARQGYQIHTAGITLVNRLAQARTEALKRNRPIAVTLDAAARTLRTTFTVGGVTTTVAGPEYLPTGVVFDLAGAPAQVIDFDSMGRPLTPPQTFTIRHTGSGQVRVITVVATGRISIN